MLMSFSCNIQAHACCIHVMYTHVECIKCSVLHVHSLLYMCGLCYQWLKSDLSVSSGTGQLRTGELMLLRVGL